MFSDNKMEEILDILSCVHYTLEYKLETICPLLSDVKVVVGVDEGFILDYEFVTTTKSGRSFALDRIISKLNSVRIYSEENTKITIENRLGSTYQFKKSETSNWVLYRDGSRECYPEDAVFEDKDYVEDTYYAIVEAKDIPKFIIESADMVNEEDRIDPMSDGKFHAADIYVISDEVLPKGLWELVRRMKKSRNMTLRLLLSKKCAEDFIKKFVSLVPPLGFESEEVEEE